MKILGVDTSSTNFSICLCDEEKTLFELKRDRSFYKDKRDAGLFNAIKELLKDINNESINALALTIGPGMFTSLRVGLALAKGLHISLGLPICTVKTFDVIAKSFLDSGFAEIKDKFICAVVIEAFQGELFVSFYNNKKKISKDLILTPRRLFDFIKDRLKNKKIFVIGPGVEIFKDIKLPPKMKGRFFILKSWAYYPSASKVVLAALPRIRIGDFDKPDLLEPYYIKKTSAELKMEKEWITR